MKKQLILLWVAICLFGSIAYSQGGIVAGVPIKWVNTLPASCNANDKTRVLVWKYSATAGFYQCLAGTYSLLGGASIGGTVTGATEGRVFFAGSGGTLAQDADFTWDNTNKRLTLADDITKGVQFGAASGTYGARIFRSSSLLYFGMPSGGQLTVLDSAGTGVFNIYQDGRTSVGAGATTLGLLPQFLVFVTTSARVGQMIQLSPSQTADAFQVLPDGSATPLVKITASGNLAFTNTALGVVLKAPDATCYRVGVANGGALTTTLITCP